MTEKELIQACMCEDRTAQRELFNRFAGKMMTVCLRYARHRAEAEDWLQDAFIRVFDNLGQYEGKGSFEGWIRRIVVNVALKNLSKLSVQREMIGVETLPDVATDPSVFSQMSEKEILNLITKLPDGYRTVFNLYVIEDFSHREVADMLNIEESTSRSQLVKARNMLQNLITHAHKIKI